MTWREYERHRFRIEEKWRPKVFKLLQRLVSSFTYELKRGASPDTFFHFGQVYPILAEMYTDAGVRMAKLQYRELRGEVPKKKAFKQPLQTKDENTDKFRSEVIRQLQISGLNLAQKITDTTKRTIILILQQGTQEGWGIEKIVSEILRKTTEVNRDRARTISRTEVGRAANAGKILAAKTLEVAMDKKWIGAKDKRERKSHWLMNDESVDMDAKFSNGMMAPGDPSAPANETVNCRCTMTFKVKRDPQGNVIPRSYYTPTTTNPIQGIAQAFQQTLSQVITEAVNEQSISVQVLRPEGT